MKAGDVIFVRGQGWVSGVIRKYDPGSFSHVAIAVSDTKIFEAQYYMRAKIVPMHYTNYETVSLGLSKKEIQKLRVACQMLEGKWYDYAQIVGYLFKAWFGCNVEDFDDPNHLICSEALDLILYMLDKIDEPLHTVTPNQLYNILKGGVLG